MQSGLSPSDGAMVIRGGLKAVMEDPKAAANEILVAQLGASLNVDRNITNESKLATNARLEVMEEMKKLVHSELDDLRKMLDTTSAEESAGAIEVEDEYINIGGTKLKRKDARTMVALAHQIPLDMSK